MFTGPFDCSIISRAISKKLVSIDFYSLRDVATDRYKSVDDRPYGGGPGMILRVDILDKALNNVKCNISNIKCVERVILLDPSGNTYSQAKARTYAKFNHLILICGHYEGVDERIRSLVDEELSIGDYVLTGGEIPAMVLVDSVVRLIPGVLKKSSAIQSESFSKKLLEYPQYTRPERYKGMDVPRMLRTGNHRAISEWNTAQSQERTRKRRPDLFTKE